MNGKLAKKLRHIAKGLNEKSPPVEFMETQYTEDTRKRKMFTEYEMDKDDKVVLDEQGEPVVKQKHQISDGTISVTQNCFRGQYHALKRAVQL